MDLTKRELINELPPIQQLNAYNVDYSHQPGKQFHQAALTCTGGTLITETHFICDKCGKEEEV